MHSAHASLMLRNGVWHNRMLEKITSKKPKTTAKLSSRDKVV